MFITTTNSSSAPADPQRQRASHANRYRLAVEPMVINAKRRS